MSHGFWCKEKQEKRRLWIPAADYICFAVVTKYCEKLLFVMSSKPIREHSGHLYLRKFFLWGGGGDSAFGRKTLKRVPPISIKTRLALKWNEFWDGKWKLLTVKTNGIWEAKRNEKIFEVFFNLKCSNLNGKNKIRMLKYVIVCICRVIIEKTHNTSRSQGL